MHPGTIPVGQDDQGPLHPDRDFLFYKCRTECFYRCTDIRPPNANALGDRASETSETWVVRSVLARSIVSHSSPTEASGF